MSLQYLPLNKIIYYIIFLVLHFDNNSKMFNIIFPCFIQIPEYADCELSSFKSDTNKITNDITQYGSEKIKCL